MNLGNKTNSSTYLATESAKDRRRMIIRKATIPNVPDMM